MSTVLASTIAFAAAEGVSQTIAANDTTKTTLTAPFTLAPLPYAPDALEPVIDSKTMETHHGRHHQAYVDKLNAEIEKEKLQGKPLEDLITNVSQYSSAIRNNGGGHWNHTFFWNIMAPSTQSGTPSPALLNAIEARFGSLDNFKVEFEKAGAAQFGSGWVWLVMDKNNELIITTTPNQDNPLMDIAEVQGTPLLVNDVWEHAYYLKHLNKRPDYLKGWWGVVNWSAVSKHYEQVIKEN